MRDATSFELFMIGLSKSLVSTSKIKAIAKETSFFYPEVKSDILWSRPGKYGCLAQSN